tara:strand:+ start:936 stop:1508 length:573 start_codon:yes stop_codon:yes gene_type:complete
MIDKSSTLIVCALEKETNNQLDDYNVLYTGVGKVNASMKLTKYLVTFGCPKLVVNYGTAGSRNIPIGDLVECRRFMQTDMDVTALGLDIGVTPFENDIPKILGDDSDYITYINREGLLCGSADSFTTYVNKDLTKVDVYDMEAYSLAKVCNHFNVPFVSFKYITDNVNGDSQGDWNSNFKKGIHKFKKVL